MNESTIDSEEETSVSIGTLLGNMEGGSFTRALRESCRRKF